MKFIITQNDTMRFVQGDTWGTIDFDSEHAGLEVDGAMVCFLTIDQANFLDILKMGEEKISNIEITDDKVLLQTTDMEAMDYERPTGSIEFQ